MKYKVGDWIVFIYPIFSFCIGDIRKIDKINHGRYGEEIIFYHEGGVCTFYNPEDFRKATRDEIIMAML